MAQFERLREVARAHRAHPVAGHSDSRPSLPVTTPGTSNVPAQMNEASLPAQTPPDTFLENTIGFASFLKLRASLRPDPRAIAEDLSLRRYSPLAIAISGYALAAAIAAPFAWFIGLIVGWPDNIWCKESLQDQTFASVAPFSPIAALLAIAFTAYASGLIVAWAAPGPEIKRNLTQSEIQRRYMLSIGSTGLIPLTLFVVSATIFGASLSSMFGASEQFEWSKLISSTFDRLPEDRRTAALGAIGLLLIGLTLWLIVSGLHAHIVFVRSINQSNNYKIHWSTLIFALTFATIARYLGFIVAVFVFFLALFSVFSIGVLAADGFRYAVGKHAYYEPVEDERYPGAKFCLPKGAKLAGVVPPPPTLGPTSDDLKAKAKSLPGPATIPKQPPQSPVETGSMSRTFRITFAPGSSSLLGSGANAVRGAAANYLALSRTQGASILLRATADRSEAAATPDNGLSLSQRRAEAVRAALAASGVPASAVRIQALGVGGYLEDDYAGRGSERDRAVVISFVPGR